MAYLRELIFLGTLCAINSYGGCYAISDFEMCFFCSEAKKVCLHWKSTKLTCLYALSDLPFDALPSG